MKDAGSRAVIELREWDETFIPHASLSGADRRLAEQLCLSRRVTIDELSAGVRVRSQSWVGLIRLDGFDLRIVPKLADGNARLVQMLALTGGIEAAWQYEAQRTLRAEALPDLLDLLSLLLVREAEKILAGGVLHDYIEREEALPALRGRFLADRQLQKRLGQFNVLECRFDEHDSDIDENRLLAFALGRCKTLVRDRRLFIRALSLHEQFASICDSDHVDTRQLRTRLVYHRLNSHYQGAHELAWLILDGMGISNLLVAGPLKSNVFLIDMNLLFERFVQRLLHFCLGKTYRLRYQLKLRSILWDIDRNRPYRSVVPDFHLSGPLGELVIDAKYKLIQKLDSADIYQCFLYAQAFSVGEKIKSRSVVLAPSSTGGIEHSRMQIRDVRGVGQSVLHVIAFPVAAAADEIQSGNVGPICNQLGALLCAVCSA